MGAVFLAAAGCQKTRTTATTPFSIDPVGCPELAASGDGKIFHAEYLRAHPSLTDSVVVRLHTVSSLPAPCNDASCAERDAALTLRQAANQREVDCVFAAFGPSGSLKAPKAEWYEPALFLTSGRPVPIGTAFSALALWSQIEAVARHPYVDSIEPAAGEAARIGVPAPPIPEECPPADDQADGKLADAAGIQDQGRQAVVIELRKALLPPLQTCQAEGTCNELLNSGWSRTIAGRRMLTCVRRFIDSRLQGAALEVGYAVADGVPSGYPALPPFGDIIHAQTAFGLGLTWDEVVEVGRHPYVERIWTSPALMVGGLPEGCPRNYDEPVVTPVCPAGTEPIAGKFTAASLAEWMSSSGPQEVLIAVRRATDICPRPACPGRGVECPELTKYLERQTEESRASQTCVRALIAEIGGTASPEVFALGNGLLASLTWDQIQTVAAHPQVAQIDRRYDGTPPP